MKTTPDCDAPLLVRNLLPAAHSEIDPEFRNQRTSRLCAKDAVFVLSVGGGDLERNVSPNLVAAVRHAKNVGAGVVGVVGRDGGFTARVADACVIIPTVNAANVTPHTEAFQAVILHLLVSHPGLKSAETKWESLK